MPRSREVVSGNPSFAEKLGHALTVWADGHPTPDESTIQFIGPKGLRAYSPRQIAQEVVGQTPFGKRQTRFYRSISRNLGDESGETVINDLLNWEWEKRP